MGAAAVPLAVGLGTATTAGQIIQSDTMKRQMENQRREQKKQAMALSAEQKKQTELSEATYKRDEMRASQLANRKGAGRQSTILTSGINPETQYGKTVLGS